MRYFVIVTEDGPEQFTAHPAGIPELRVTAPSRREAVEGLKLKLLEWIRDGRLTTVEVPEPDPRLQTGRRIDPNDPMEQEFIREIARGRRELDEQTGVWDVDPDDVEGQKRLEEARRARREELKGTIWDYDLPCRDSSSTPTT